MDTENERIKLKATFYNTIAAGAAVAGLVVPYITLYSSMVTNYAGYVSHPQDFIRGDTIVGMLCAFGISAFFRSRANTWIQTLDDE